LKNSLLDIDTHGHKLLSNGAFHAATQQFLLKWPSARHQRLIKDLNQGCSAKSIITYKYKNTNKSTILRQHQGPVG